MIRERARGENGTLGEAVYAITDMPAHLYDLLGDAAPTLPVPQTRRSQPMWGNPTQVEPTQVHPAPKNTKRKKTNRQNTNPVHPSVRTAPARESDDTAAPTEPIPEPDLIEATSGVRRLLALGTEHPELLLTGPALRDQGAVITTVLESGWNAE
ncbi:hypothetical protein ACIQ9Q_40540 [Streptomyces sp. NPDC094438]|uniref:hypothetical protein n=1 Tax=Streptomyces sp. NPDC094438 TaxID=3366061 RepID=UPI0038205708